MKYIPNRFVLKVVRWLESYPPVPVVVPAETGEEIYWAGLVD